MDAFTKSLIWLLDYYPKLQIRSKEEIAQNFMESISIEFSWDDLQGQILKDIDEPNNDHREKLLSNILLVDDACRVLVKFYNKPLNREVIESILDTMVLINSQLASLISDYDFDEGVFSGDKEYQQSPIIIEFLTVLKKDRICREKLQAQKPEIEIINSKNYQRISKYDVSLLEAHFEYLKIILILIIIMESPYYSNVSKEISKLLLKCLKEILVNCRIEELYMEPNLNFCEQERGSHTTTKLEFFFIQSNNDHYCLRIDFPHDEIHYVHFNLHEPFRNASFPITHQEYDLLCDECGADLSDYFYSYGSQLWFKSNFETMISNALEPDSKQFQCLHTLFKQHQHFPFILPDKKQNDINVFLGDLFNAISMFSMPRCKYEKPKGIDVNERLHQITLREKIREVEYCIDSFNLDRQINGNKHELEIGQIRRNLIAVLTEYRSMFSKEELEAATADELLEWVNAVL